MTNQHKRFGNRWTINEVLSLQREFELLNLDIDTIALRHQRTPNAIMFKLDEEGFADYNVLYSNYHNLNSHIPIEKKSDTELQFQPEDDDEEQYDDDDEEQYDDDDEYVPNDNEEDEDEDDDEDENANVGLANRVYGLEESISEIKDILRKIMGSFISQESQS